MNLGQVDVMSHRSPAPARATVRPPAEPARKQERVAQQPTLSTFAKLLENITGRKVKLVPPTAYLVSPPTTPAPKTPEVSVAIAADLSDEPEERNEPLVVDVSAVLRDGTSNRMILGSNAEGGLALFAGVNRAL